MKPVKLPFIARLSLVLISIIGVGFLAKLGESILAPLFFAFLLAILFLPITNFLERKLRFSRTLSTMASVVLMIVFIGGIVYFFSSQVSDFAKDFPQLEKQITKTFHQLQAWILKTFHLNLDSQMNYLNQGLEKLLASSGIIFSGTLAMFSTVLGFAAFSILFFIFILNYRRLLYNFLISIFPDRHILKVRGAFMEAQQIIKHYISGLLIQILIVSILTSVLLSILGVKYAILLGVLTGFMNVIPYVGIFVSCLLACLISLATGGQHTLFVLLGYLGIHAIDANVTLPLVVGSKVKINALFSFLALLIGEHLWGISGMFLSIPMLAIFKIIFERIDEMKPVAKVMGEDETPNDKNRKYLLAKRLKRIGKREETISTE